MDVDKRLVHTAVVGAAASRRPVTMPRTRFEAREFLGDFPGADFWCGTWLGGCGRQLTTRVGMANIPHFAHWPDHTGRLPVCVRLHNDNRSADHLFVDRDLTAWARQRGRRRVQINLKGDFSRGGTCTSLDLAVHDGAGSHGGVVTVVFKADNMSRWYSGEDTRRSELGWHNWVFGPGVASPQVLLDRDGYALHLKLEPIGSVSGIEIGTRLPEHGIEWASLDDCVIDERGISTPFVEDVRRQRRTAQITTPTIARKPPTVSPARLAAPDPVPPLVPLPRPADTHHACGEAPAPGDLIVSEVRLRRAVLKIGREYAFNGDAARAGIAARLGQTVTVTPPEMPAWLWADIERAFGMARKIAPRHSSPAASEVVLPGVVELGEELDDIGVSEQLLAFFAAIGCPVLGDVRRLRLLRVATVHVSYLNENRLADHVSQPVLRGLAELAKRHLRTAVLDRYVQDRQPRTVSEQTTAFASDERETWEAVAKLPIFEDVGHFGRSELATARDWRSRSRLDVLQQVVGVAALFGEHAAIRRLVDRVASSQSAPTAVPVVDGRTRLNQVVKQADQSWEWTRSGTEHEPRFTARVTDLRGRSAEGTATSKKAAGRVAAEAFVRRWLPQIHFEGGAQRVVTPPRVRSALEYEFTAAGHRSAVDSVQSLFRLPHAARPFVAQALTHRSWTYENQQTVGKSHQRDNMLLAHHGSVIVDLLVTDHRLRLVLSRTARPDLKELILSTPEERSWQELFRTLRLAPGLLLGAGMRSNPEPAFGGAMQALLAVAWRFIGSNLLADPPSVLAEWIESHGPVQDSATRLQQTCALFGIELEFDVAQRGMDNEADFLATAILSAEGSRRTVIGTWDKGDKAAAKKRCAWRILRIFYEITHCDLWRLAADEREVAALILRAQVRSAPDLTQRSIERCRTEGHLGTSHVLSDDDDAYKSWSRQVKDLIGDRLIQTDERLADVYGRAAEVAE